MSSSPPFSAAARASPRFLAQPATRRPAVAVAMRNRRRCVSGSAGARMVGASRSRTSITTGPRSVTANRCDKEPESRRRGRRSPARAEHELHDALRALAAHPRHVERPGGPPETRWAARPSSPRRGARRRHREPACRTRSCSHRDHLAGGGSGGRALKAYSRQVSSCGTQSPSQRAPSPRCHVSSSSVPFFIVRWRTRPSVSRRFTWMSATAIAPPVVVG